jgi:hypothetical protein
MTYSTGHPIALLFTDHHGKFLSKSVLPPWFSPESGNFFVWAEVRYDFSKLLQFCVPGVFKLWGKFLNA